MITTINGTILDVVSRPYEIEDRKGVSHKVLVYNNGKIQYIKINPNQVSEFQGKIGQDIELNCFVYIQGKYNLKVA